jgi:hypothetical protein
LDSDNDGVPVVLCTTYTKVGHYGYRTTTTGKAGNLTQSSGECPISVVDMRSNFSVAAAAAKEFVRQLPFEARGAYTSTGQAVAA